VNVVLRYNRKEHSTPATFKKKGEQKRKSRDRQAAGGGEKWGDRPRGLRFCRCAQIMWTRKRPPGAARRRVHFEDKAEGGKGGKRLKINKYHFGKKNVPEILLGGSEKAIGGQNILYIEENKNTEGERMEEQAG